MEKRLIQSEDLFRMKFTGSPALAPDGTKVVYVVTGVSEAKNGYYSSLYISDSGSKPIPFTNPNSHDYLIKDTSPKWSFDGETVAFLSNRTGTQQIWLISNKGGEAQKLTNEQEDVTYFNWSADGKKIVYTVKERTDEEMTDDFTVITRLRYKGDGEGFRNTYQQVAMIDVATGNASALTHGPYHYHSPQFTPQGDKVIYLAAKNEDHQLVNIDNIYQFDLTLEKESLIYKGQGMIADPSVSPCGKWLAYAGHDEGETSSANTWVWLLSLEDYRVNKLTASFDHPAGNYVITDAQMDNSDRIIKWQADGKGLYFLATVRGDCYVKRVTLNGDVSEKAIYEDSVITSFDAWHDCLVFVKANPLSTGDLFWQNGIESAVQITNNNKELYDDLNLSTPEFFTFKSDDCLGIDGWLLPPVDYQKGEKYPVVLQIHGGPHMAYGNTFSHEFQLLAAKGYAVFYCNPRGSQGYGDDFVKACVGDWANRDRQDIMTGLDVALDKFSICDPERLFVTGGSYGGYMTNMIISHSNRFKAAVTQRCICNIYSFLGTSDIGFYFGPSQLGGIDQWEDEETFMRFSPIRYARSVKTPTCIIHSEEDLRCPIEQAEQWFIALKRLGVDTRLVRFNDEDHNLSRSGRPRNRIRRLKEITQWFSKHSEIVVSDKANQF